MHEFSLASAIVSTAAKHAAGRRVTAVSLRVGQLRQVVPDTLDFYFGVAARETVCDGARLEQQLVPAVLRCAQCGHAWEVGTGGFRCPACGEAEAEVESGDELEVEWIEAEEAKCTAPR